MAKAKLITAFCWASGVIEFGPRARKGSLPIMRGPARQVRLTVAATCRHAYDGKTLLVPGVPEAPNQNAAVEALIAWQEWAIKRRAAKGRSA